MSTNVEPTVTPPVVVSPPKEEIKSVAPAPISQAVLEEYAKSHGYIKADDTTKSQFKLKESVSTGAFIGFVCYILYNLIISGEIQWNNWNEGFYSLFVQIIVFSIFIAFGIEKPSIVAAAMTIIKIIFDPKLDAGAKINFIREYIEKLVGIALVIQTQQLEAKNKEVK